MAIANLVVRISADTAAFEKNIKAVERTLQRSGKQWESVGDRMTKGITLPIIAVAGVAAKAAIDFESSFAGIRKTVNATEAQFASLSKGMRDLAKTIPVNVNELNRIGEAAGQLGIKTDQILDFTKVMAQLGVTTNLSAEQAATSLARFANIMDATKVSAGTFEFDRLGATIVDLGNNFATTEAEIVDFGTRIAGAGKIAGLAKHQVLAIGAAMSSVGIEAESGGTAVQKVLNKMTEAVATNNKQLQVFAATAGLSAKQFADAFREDAGQAFARFVSGIGEQGDRAFGTLKNLGLGNERVIRSFLSLGNAGDLLTRTLQTGGDAWRANTALAAEAEQRFKTTQSQLILLKNNLQDVAITLGQALLPILNDFLKAGKPFVESLAQMAAKFGELPKGIQTTAFAFVGLLASIGPTIFVFSKIQQGVAGLLAAFRFLIPDMAAAGSTAAKSGQIFTGFLGTLGRFAGPIALVVTGLVAAKRAFDAFSRSTEEGLRVLAGPFLTGIVDKLSAAFPRLRGVLDDVASIVKNSMILAFRELGNALDTVREAISRTVAVIAQSFQPVLDAFLPGLGRLGTVISTVVVPAIKAAAIGFITALPPVQSFLLLLSQVPGFSEIEGALDRVAKKMQGLVDEANHSIAAITGLGVVFTGGMVSADKWGNALDAAKKNILSASTATLSFGANVAGHVVKPIEITSDKMSEFAKKLKALKEQLSGRDLVDSAKAWAAALKAPGIELQVLANKSLRQDLVKALDAVEEHFGSLAKAGVGGLEQIRGEAKALELAMQPLANIPITFTVPTDRFLGGGAFRDLIPEIPRSVLMSAVIDPIIRNPVNLEGLDARVAIARVKAGLQTAIDASTPLNFWQKMLGDTKALGAAISDSILRAIQGGGNVIGAAAGSLGQFFTTKLATYLTAAKDLGGKAIGGFLGGAIQSILPGLGALLGPLVSKITDVIAGAFDRNKGRDAVKAFAESFGGFNSLQKRLQEMGAEGDRLWKKLTQGVGRNNPEQAAAAIKEVEAALAAFGTEAERAQRRLDALGVAIAGVNKKAELFSAPFQKLLESRRGTEGDEFDAITRKMQATAQAGQAEFERLGLYVGATFAGMVKETGDVFGAITALTPAFKVLQESVDQFGLTSTGVIDKLLSAFGLINDEVMGPILQSIQATGQIFAGLQDAGYMTADLFQTVGADIGAAFREIELKGGDVATAMALSQPILQRLWEAQQIYGEITDETTAKLLKQAEEQGLVGAHMKDVNQKILDVLIAIADVFGAVLPESFRKTSSAAREAARDIEHDFSRINIPPIKIDIEYTDPGVPGHRVPAMAHGGIVRRPTLALIGEAGPEAVIPLSQLSGISSGGSTTVILEMDGRAVAEASVPHIPGVVRRYGLV